MACCAWSAIARRQCRANGVTGVLWFAVALPLPPSTSSTILAALVVFAALMSLLAAAGMALKAIVEILRPDFSAMLSDDARAAVLVTAVAGVRLVVLRVQMAGLAGAAPALTVIDREHIVIESRALPTRGRVA